MTATLALMITLCQLNKECKCGEVRNSRVDPPHLAYMKWGTTHHLPLCTGAIKLFVIVHKVFLENMENSEPDLKFRK